MTTTEATTKPWRSDEMIWIDGRPYSYHVDGHDVMVHFINGVLTPLSELRKAWHIISMPTRTYGSDE